MKTKIITPLGAVLSLLVTLGSKHSAAALARLLIIGLAALAASPGASAASSSTGGGTIYYLGPWKDTTSGGNSVMTTMNSDGSNKTQLPGLGMFGYPSWALHNNHRWFIYTYPITGQYYPNGIQRSEVFALRDDFVNPLNNNGNTIVQLTGDITLQPSVGSTDWVPGDQLISFNARRWSSADPDATVVEGGIYTASLVFGGDGNIIGLAAQPTAPAIPFPLVESAPGDLWPDLLYYSWAPTGDMVTYSNYADNELWVADLLNAHRRIYRGQAHAPQWSPDGLKIAFSNGRGISTIKPDGSGRKATLIIANTSPWGFSHPYWSPSASHIVYIGQLSGSNMDVFQATASGGNKVNLTNTPYPFNEYLHPGSGGGWR